MIKIIVADDHRLFLEGVNSILNSLEGIEVVATAANGQQVLQCLGRLACDVVVMDINMPGGDGLATAQRISQEHGQVKVVLVSMAVNPEYVKEALRAGVSGYILKDSSPVELEKAIRHAHAGGKHYSESVMMHLAYEYMADGTAADSKVKLTQRELQVLKLLAQEFTAPEIAEKLFISAETVETHKKNMLKKLKLKNSYSLVKYAMQHGLV